MRNRNSVTTAILPVLFTLLLAARAGATPPDAQAARRGERAFARYCVSCHGARGDGRGPSAEYLDPRPRDFTGGTFKFRSTPSGELPADADLYRTVDRGLAHTLMPPWHALTEAEKRDMVQYLKTFSPRFQEEPQGKPVAIPPRPTFTPELVKKGNATWEKMQCASCHGAQGKGDGPSAPTLLDDWGHKVTPRDFTSGPLKVGDEPEDLYRAFITGINGTPMPSFTDSLTPEEAWALVAYVRTLRKD